MFWRSSEYCLELDNSFPQLLPTSDSLPFLAQIYSKEDRVCSLFKQFNGVVRQWSCVSVFTTHVTVEQWASTRTVIQLLPGVLPFEFMRSVIICATFHHRNTKLTKRCWSCFNFQILFKRSICRICVLFSSVSSGTGVWRHVSHCTHLSVTSY